MFRYTLIASFSVLLLASPALANDLVANCGSCGATAAEEAHDHDHAEDEAAAGCENCGTAECTCDHHEEAAGCENCGTDDCTCDHAAAEEAEAEATDDTVEEAAETAEEATE